MDEPLRDRPRDLLISGHINVDRFLRVDRFPPVDRTVPVVASRAELGGTATNIALTASKNGVATGLMARIGAEFPRTFLEQLSAAGVDLRGVERIQEPTPTCYIVEDARGAQRTLIEQGAMRDGIARPRARIPWLSEYSWLHIATGPPDLQLAVVREARQRGLRVAADPAQELHYRWTPLPLRKLLGESELLFGNRWEIDRAASLLHAGGARGLLRHVPTVIRTEGARGATSFSHGSATHVPGKRPRRIRTVVGAGDAFRGGFYAGWFAGEPMKTCLEAGNRAAARWLEGAR